MPPKAKDEPPPPPPKQLKIFIHEMDGYLGKVLGEQAKKNVAEGEEPIICGSLADPKAKPSWADEVVKRDDLLGLKKALLTSDVIVYDIASAPKDATSALKVLLKYDYEDDTEKVMIGVSSLLSWAGNSAPVVVEGDDAAGEPQAPLTSAQVAERRPHPNYKAQVTVENLIINKGNVKKDKLKTYVLWSGVLYGCGEGVLHSLFKCSWLGTHKALPVLGTGANRIPMIHVADLAGMVLAVAKERPSEFNTILAVDRGEATLREVASAISSSLQSGEVKESSPEEYLEFMTAQQEPHVHSILLQLNIRMNFVRGEALGYGEESDKWVAGGGLVENIATVVAEYREWRSLLPIRVLFHGPPASYWYPTEEGRVDLARDFADEYQVTLLDTASLVSEYKALPPFAEGGTDLSAKLKEALGEDEEGAGGGGEVPEELVVQVVQHKLQTPPCRNQGWVLRGFPPTAELAQALFDVDKVPAEGEAAEEEAAVEVGEGEEAPPPLAPLPQTVLSLVAPQQLLLDRIAAIPQEEAEAAGETEEAFMAGWAAFEAANPLDEQGVPLRDEGLLGLLLTNKPNPEAGRPTGCDQVVEIVCDNELAFIQDKIRLSVGEPRNYDPDGPRRRRDEAAREAEQARADEAEAQRKAEEEASRSEREERARADAEKLARLQEEEREALLLRSQPMRKYLMDNVLPALTRGLQEVAKLRPDDPVDALADYLFKVDPQLN